MHTKRLKLKQTWHPSFFIKNLGNELPVDLSLETSPQDRWHWWLATHSQHCPSTSLPGSFVPYTCVACLAGKSFWCRNPKPPRGGHVLPKNGLARYPPVCSQAPPVGSWMPGQSAMLFQPSNSRGTPPANQVHTVYYVHVHVRGLGVHCKFAHKPWYSRVGVQGL